MTYAQLIYQALRSRKTKQMGLAELYDWFERKTGRAKKGSKGWKNSVRSNLSLNKAFQRVDDKGSCWKLVDAGSTEFQPTRKHRASRGKKAKLSTSGKSSAVLRPTPCASSSHDVVRGNMSETCHYYGSPRTLHGSTSPESRQPEGGRSADYPTPMPIISTQDGLERMHNPLWAWNLDSSRYINWPYCRCFCSRHQLGWAGVGGTLQSCAATASPPTLVNAGSSPLSEMSVQWGI
ncbi:hypothetical protein LZ31DRAFT_191123 [Colletotrichum somersetense]|nr:hypothetical protein LZ31DRAFT_191123 [Colletotrichum somersetense]